MAPCLGKPRARAFITGAFTSGPFHHNHTDSHLQRPSLSDTYLTFLSLLALPHLIIVPYCVEICFNRGKSRDMTLSPSADSLRFGQSTGLSHLPANFPFAPSLHCIGSRSSPLLLPWQCPLVGTL